jgi:hypothetical protein
MNISRTRRTTAGIVAGLTVIAGLDAATAVARQGDTASATIITVTQAHGELTVSPGTTVAAGRVTINYTAPKGDHTLQAAVIRPGYTSDQFGKDINAALNKGNVKAVRRVDSKVAWLGGAESLGGATGTFSTVLPAGTVFLFDQNSDARVQLTVTSPATPGAVEQAVATVRVTKHLHWATSATLPATGWVNLHNNSTEPHFFVVQRVKESTTASKVRAFIKKGARGNPPWGLKANANSGVFSPGTTTQFLVHVPAGKYLLLCFWPSKKNGMPHFMMGMWKLVHLK